MINKVIDAIKDMIGVLKKESAMKSVEFLNRTIVNDILPVLEDILANSNDKFIKDNKMLSNLGKLSKMKVNNNKDVIVDIRDTFTNIVKNINTMEQLVNKYLPNNTTKETLTVKQGVIIKVISDLMSMSSYTLDLLYYILLNSSTKVNTNFPKIKLQQIEDGLLTYCEMYSVYSNDLNKILKDVTDVSEEQIDDLLSSENENSWAIDLAVAKTGKVVKLPISDGFIGNPIYHFRMWLVNKDMEKYESLKNKKQLIEMKLTELRLRQKNEIDSSLEKQIAYYEEKLNKIEYKIVKIEN